MTTHADSSNSSIRIQLTGVRSLSRSFLPVAGQWVAASGLSTIAFDSGASDGSQNDFSSCRAGVAGFCHCGKGFRRTCSITDLQRLARRSSHLLDGKIPRRLALQHAEQIFKPGGARWVAQEGFALAFILSLLVRMLMAPLMTRFSLSSSSASSRIAICRYRKYYFLSQGGNLEIRCSEQCCALLVMLSHLSDVVL